MTLSSVLYHVLLLACISMCLIQKATADSSSFSYSNSNSWANSGSNAPSQICPPFEVYNECGSSCPPICDEPPPEACTAQCVIGCFCQPGFIRRTRGAECIPESHCLRGPVPPLCPGIEVYQKCGSACPPSCDNGGLQIQGCADVCVEGCFCPPGFIRFTQGGPCVPENSCPSLPPSPPTQPGTCNPWEEYLTCGSPCAPICDEHYGEIIGCAPQCVEGCYCIKGFIRDTRGGICIPERDCPNKPIPVTCPPNEVYQDCGSACPPTCNQGQIQGCSTECVKGCFCADGFIRSTNGGICVLKQLCPPQIG